MRLLIFFLLLPAFLYSSTCVAQPKGIHLSWNGRKKVKTSTTMAITWLNDKAGKGRVQYGKAEDNLDKSAKAKAKYSEPLKSYVNKITLEHLEPATQYYYRVGSANTGWSAVYKFRTGPKTGDKAKVVIALWSDTQNNERNYNFEQTDSIVKEMSKNAYYFTIHNGDIVENGSVTKSWKSIFDIAQPINANYPFMSVTGNHDVVNDTASPIFQTPFPVYYDLFNLPNNQLNYSYDYGNTHFIAINSGYAQGAEKVGKVLFSAGSAEYKWLEADLAKARKNKDVTWIIMYSHYPVYSYGFSHVPTWQKQVRPLVDKYEVDLYLAGHRHVYERHKPVRGSEVFEPTDMHVYEKPKGTVYITNGSCGGSLQGIGGSKLPTMVFTPNEKLYTYEIMTIEDRTINYQVFDKYGKQIDYFRIVK
jgi:acid phosphatase type 7